MERAARGPRVPKGPYTTDCKMCVSGPECEMEAWAFRTYAELLYNDTYLIAYCSMIHTSLRVTRLFLTCHHPYRTMRQEGT
jgi:hypothetical protein